MICIFFQYFTKDLKFLQKIGFCQSTAKNDFQLKFEYKKL